MAVSLPQSVKISPERLYSGSVTITWDAPATYTGSITSYTVFTQVSIDNGATWKSYVQRGTTTASVRTFSISVYDFDFQDLIRAAVRCTAGGETSSYGISSNTSNYDFIPATAPTSFSLSATLAEGNVILSWAGATSGAGPISGYQIQYSESSNNSSWGAWTDLTFYSTMSADGSISVAPSTTRGNYRRFRIQTVPSYGDTYASGWAISSNSVRRNTLPTAPTIFTASPSIYQSGTITLSWSGAAAGTSSIKNYVLQVSTSTDNNTWGSWTALTTVTTTATSGSYSYTPGTLPVYNRYRICVTDTMDCLSPYVTSNTLIRNSPPPTPTITAPKAGSTTYNTQPRILITLGTEPDGDRQMLCVKTASGVWQDSVNNPSDFSRSGWLGDNTAVKYRHAVLTTGSKSISVKAKDEGVQAESAEAARSFTVAASPFAVIIANETPVKAAHITTLRTAVNNVRNYYGLAAAVWSEEMVSGKTQIRNWSTHISELRKAVVEIVDFINKYDTPAVFDVPAFEWIPLQSGRPRAAVMEQLHGLILQL